MAKVNLTKTLKRYTSGWVSISKDYKRVIASGKDLDSLVEKLRKKGNPEGYLMKAARDYSHYIGS